MKKGILAGCALLLVLLTSAVLYNFAYPISADLSNLPEYADRHLDHTARTTGHAFPSTITMHETIRLGNRAFVLADINEQLGEIRLTRGLNGKYRIGSISYGGGNFREEVVEIDGKQYMLFGGRNTYFGIREAVFTLDGPTCRLEIPQQDRFFVYAEVAPETESHHILPDKIQFYDADGNDITEEVPWN